MIHKLVLSSFVFLFLISLELRSCTTLIAGRNTTKDGSILYAKSEDDSEQLDYLWYIPRKTHAPGEVIYETGGLKIPQVEETYAYFWDQPPGTYFSSVIINEWGVAFGSNGCVSKEDDAGMLEKRGDIVNGGIGFRLRFILAERCQTAREAVLLAAELIDTYGYNASGRCLNIVGPNEAWQLQMVCGKHYAARRVQDNEVVLLANTFSIREVNMEDTLNFICSPDLIEYAIQRGWYHADADGTFDFAEAYAPDNIHKASWNTHRVWIMAKLLQKDFTLTIGDAENGLMPVSVKPDRKLAVEDMMLIFRNHYEDTPLCLHIYEKISPHFIDNAPLCNDATHRANIIQQRNWLPVEIGTVNWRALSHPCESLFIPWYLGIDSIPQVYHMGYEDPVLSNKTLIEYHFKGPEWQLGSMDVNSASCIFRLLNNIGDAAYFQYQPKIREVFDQMEKNFLYRQPQIEEEALKLYNEDTNKARLYLTGYTISQAMAGFDAAKKLVAGFLHQ